MHDPRVGTAMRGARILFALYLGVPLCVLAFIFWVSLSNR